MGLPLILRAFARPSPRWVAARKRLLVEPADVGRTALMEQQAIVTARHSILRANDCVTRVLVVEARQGQSQMVVCNRGSSLVAARI